MVFRYDLQAINNKGEGIEFDDIYPDFENIKLKQEAVNKVLKETEIISSTICDCRGIN